MPTCAADRLITLFRRFRNEERGSVVVYFAIALLPVVLMMGAAVDYERALAARTKMQNAVDAAAVAVAMASKSTAAQRQTLAQNTVNANLGPMVNVLNPTVTETDPAGSTTYYQVTAQGSIPTAIMTIAHINSISIGANSHASNAASNPNGGTGKGCVLSLDLAAVDDIWDAGNSNVNLANCDLYDNSHNGTALLVDNNAKLAARMVSVVGGVSGSSNITTTNGVFSGQLPASDPYANVPLPQYTTGCDSAHTNYSTHDTVTLNPGVYCGGFSLNSNAVVSLNPGLYVFDRGAFSINGQATLKSVASNGHSGVTLVFTSSTGSNWPTVTINGGAIVNLAAPTQSDVTNGNTGMANMVVYVDRSMTVGTAYKFNGGDNQTLSGALYAPEAALTYAGGGVAGTNGCLQLIGDTIRFTGNSTVAINGCGNYSLTAIGQNPSAKLVP
jgi:Flp pilus assembly protein TadG